MKKSVLRLITMIVTIALLCGATLCFSLSSSAENLLGDTWTALDSAQAAAVSCSGGVLSINAGLVEGDVKAGQTLNLAAGTYTLTATKGGDPMSFSAK